MHINSKSSSNQLELLLFTLGDDQLYGINVHKVRELAHVPQIYELPNADPRIVGISDFRGEPTMIIDLNLALGKGHSLSQDPDAEKHVAYTSFNNKTQSFLVGNVVQIERFDWADVKPIPVSKSNESYLTSVTYFQDKLIEILDVERVIDEVLGTDGFSSDLVEQSESNIGSGYKVLVVDDSQMARTKTVNVLSGLGIESEVKHNGRQALEYLHELSALAKSKSLRIEDELLLIITDVEMPQLDGITLIQEIRKHTDLKKLHVVVQSSIAKSVGSLVDIDCEIDKWNEGELISHISNLINMKKDV